MAHPNRPNRGVTLVKLLGILAVTGVLAAGVLVPVIGGVGLTGKAEADRFLSTDCTLKETSPSTKTTLYASDGKTQIAQFFAQNRVPVLLKQIPVPMQKALIDTEDRRFYDHHGVDARGLLRAAVSNSEDSGDTQGGSTLTMQYVKQLRYYNATTDDERAAAIDQTVDRKIQDAKCALDLEKRDTAAAGGNEVAAKNQILQNYFNIAFFGENAYGVQSAAQTYFGVDVSKLSMPQAAMLVGLVQAPDAYDPFKNPTDALARRNAVLDNMATAGDLTVAQVAKYKTFTLGLAAKTPPPVQMGCSYAAGIPNAGYFCDYAVAWLASHGISQDVLLRQGLKIVTTLDAALQTSGQNAVWSADPDNRGGAFQPDSASSLVMPSVDPRTGDVTTMITSRRYTNPLDLNAANDPNQTSVPLFTTAAAGAGSTYKYFTTLLAMEAGVDASYTLTAGAPYTTKNCGKYYENGQLKTYTARNAGNYAATLPLEKALYESSNTYFVGVEDQLFDCNTRPIADLAVNLGMSAIADKTKAGELDRTPTFTLGQEGTSPLQLASAYATIANDGTYCPPNAITSITSQDGKPVNYKKEACVAKIAPQIARNVVQILTKDTDTAGGTARSVFAANGWYSDGGSPVASKTGTNNASDCTGDQCVDNGKNSAIWFVGLTPTLVSAATVFNFKSPNSTIKGLPGYNDGYASGDAFGAAAGAYFLEAYGPSLKATPGGGPSPDDVPGVAVPDVTGKTPADATAILEGAGFKVGIPSYTCGGRQPAGTLIGYNPKKAQPGSTITGCVSNGKAPSGGGTTRGTGTGTGTGNPGTGTGTGGTTGGNGGGDNGGTTGGDGGRPGG